MKGPMRHHLVLAILVALTGRAMAAADAPAGISFDPARHMRVSEVRAGMSGYGLSVFKGTRIDRFEVEVISVLRHFNPKYDVVLVRCKGQNLEHTGSIAGMSGSPIFLRDGEGRDRMVGAFAYGWPLMKDPVGGVQPIEYMLKIPHRDMPARKAVATMPTAAITIGRPRWVAADCIMLPGMAQAPASYPFAGLQSMKLNPRLGVDDGSIEKLRPLATPLMTGGLPSQLLSDLEPIFKAYGLVPLQSGSVSGSASPDQPPAKLEPGSVLAVPLLTGDVEMTAVGTCTEVQGPFVLGFGHPFNNEGPIALPVGPGEINAVIANLMTSFKLGASTGTNGTLYEDDTVGVAGKIGELPPTIPIHVEVSDAQGANQRSYSFRAASHRKFTPLLSTAAVMAAITGTHELPEYHTLDYDLTIEFTNGQVVHIENTDVNTNAAALFFELGGPMIAAAENPFEEVSVKKVEGRVRITPEAHHATILWVNAPRLKYRPGETVKAYVSFRPFRGAEAMMPIEFELPHDLPDGPYQFSISGWEQFLSDEQTSKPFRFSAESTSDLFSVLRELGAVKHNAMYLRLLRQADGVAIGRTAMPNLPSSRREVLIGAGRSNTTAFVSSATKAVPMQYVLDGAAQLELKIEKEERVENAAGKVMKHEHEPTGQPAKPEEPKPPAKPKPEAPAPGSENPPG
jgi:hypothetical protein